MRLPGLWGQFLHLQPHLQTLPSPQPSCLLWSRVRVLQPPWEAPLLPSHAAFQEKAVPECTKCGSPKMPARNSWSPGHPRDELPSTRTSFLPCPPWLYLHPGEAGTLQTQGQEEQGMPRPAKKPPSKATAPGDHPAPPRSMAQGRCHHHSAGTWEIPLKTKTRNKVHIYFYKEKKETKRF